MSDTMDKLTSTLGELMKRAKEVGGQTLEAVDKNGAVREIGKLYFEQQQGTANGFFAPLFAQAKERAENIRSIGAEIDSLREKIAEESGEKDIEVEIGAFDDIVSADEKAATGEE